MWFIDSSRHIVVTLETRSDGQKNVRRGSSRSLSPRRGAATEAATFPIFRHMKRSWHVVEFTTSSGCQWSEFEVPAEL